MNIQRNCLDYADLIENSKYIDYEIRNRYGVVIPMWNNTPRRNESRECAYFEPERKYKYAFLTATREAIEETREPAQERENTTPLKV